MTNLSSQARANAHQQALTLSRRGRELFWPVPDDSTAMLMEGFYGAMKRGETKAEALREAMLGTRKVHPDPVAWAGFLILGDAS